MFFFLFINVSNTCILVSIVNSDAMKVFILAGKSEWKLDMILLLSWIYIYIIYKYIYIYNRKWFPEVSHNQTKFICDNINYGNWEYENGNIYIYIYITRTVRIIKDKNWIILKYCVLY